MKLSDLRNVWSGDTVYVAGSSGAWDHLDPKFFDDKRTLAVNLVPAIFGLSEDAISVSQYGYMPDRLRELGWNGVAVAPRNERVFDMSETARYQADERTIRTGSTNQTTLDLSRWPSEDDDWLLVGSTSLHSAIYLAWYMGASSIVTVAADHGSWNGKDNGGAYPDSRWRIWPWGEHTNALASHIRGLGVNVYSMIPTVNLNLEGLRFEGFRARIGL